MRAYGIEKDTMLNIAGKLGVTVEFGTDHSNGYNFTLRWLPRMGKDDMTYRHKSISWQSERYTRSVCFHGHYDFMYEVFLAHPEDARITSSWYGKMDYRDMESFQKQAKVLAHTKIGAPIMDGYPQMIQSCDCGIHGYGLVHDIDIQEVRDAGYYPIG